MIFIITRKNIKLTKENEAMLSKGSDDMAVFIRKAESIESAADIFLIDAENYLNRTITTELRFLSRDELDEKECFNQINKIAKTFSENPRVFWFSAKTTDKELKLAKGEIMLVALLFIKGKNEETEEHSKKGLCCVQ